MQKWKNVLVIGLKELTNNKLDMKIIKKGKVEKKEWKGFCLNCHCEFIYDQSDIKIDQREGDYVVCPTCDNFINAMGRNNPQTK